MRKKIFTIASVTLLLVACQTKTQKDSLNQETVGQELNTEVKLNPVNFEIAKNYFVKNTVGKLDNPKIETSEKFNQIFGMATTMGKEGKPTAIDFTKKYVIAYLLPKTDLETAVNPTSLEKNDKGEITLNYKIVVGKKQSYTTIPNFVIIVDKTENGKLTLTETK